MKRKILLLVLLFAFLFTLSADVFAVSAATGLSSDVLSDLERDSTFDKNKYPVDFDDYSVKVIQVAEGEDKNLFVYCYQPSLYDFDAKYISISYGFTPDGRNLSPKLYDLECVSENGVFHKYLVKNYTVTTDAYRYYNIVGIYRPYIEGIDWLADTVITNCVSYNVGQQWCCYYEDFNLVYEMNTFETMTVEITKNSFIRFYDGISWRSFGGVYTAGDVHFVAFDSNDFDIEHIYNASLTYKTQEVSYNSFSGDDKYSDPSDFIDCYLDEEDEITVIGKGLGSRTFVWNKILPGKEFVETLEDQDVSFKEGDKDIIKKSDYVFTFLETKYDGSDPGATYQYYNYTKVCEVGILRIEFMDIHGDIYNLGVVSNLTDQQSNPSGSFGTTPDDEPNYILILLGVIILLLLLSFLSGPLNVLFGILTTGIKLILNVLLMILAIPIKLLQRLFSSGGGS